MASMSAPSASWRRGREPRCLRPRGDASSPAAGRHRLQSRRSAACPAIPEAEHRRGGRDPDDLRAGPARLATGEAKAWKDIWAAAKGSAVSTTSRAPATSAPGSRARLSRCSSSGRRPPRRTETGGGRIDPPFHDVALDLCGLVASRDRLGRTSQRAARRDGGRDSRRCASPRRARGAVSGDHWPGLAWRATTCRCCRRRCCRSSATCSSAISTVDRGDAAPRLPIVAAVNGPAPAPRSARARLGHRRRGRGRLFYELLRRSSSPTPATRCSHRLLGGARRRCDVARRAISATEARDQSSSGEPARRSTSRRRSRRSPNGSRASCRPRSLRPSG